MPFIKGKNKTGCYIKYGQSGHEYYYTCGNSDAEKRAREKSGKQAAAIHASKAAQKNEITELVNSLRYYIYYDK